MGEPFADFVGVTVPEEDWEGLRVDVSAVLDVIGMQVEVDEARSVLWRSPDAVGTVKASKVGRVWALGCSGTVCAGLRAFKVFTAYLSAVGQRPHRVTRLDASLDVAEDAAPVVQAITAKGRQGGLSLTRKAIPPTEVLALTAARPDGAVSGTVYCGSKRADVRMVVYDKQLERARHRLPDCGPLTRYELRLKGGAGITLRDCAEPASVFWHYVAPDFLSRPEGVPSWTPHGSGFVIDRPSPALPAARLKTRVELSTEVDALLNLAAEVGPHGFGLLVSLLKQRAGGRGLPAETASGLH